MSFRPRVLASLLPLLVCFLPFSAGADEAPILAIVGARVLPVAGDPIDDGVILVQGGKILAVGARADVEVPAGAEEIDAGGLVATPGLIDAASSLYLSEEEAGRPSRSPDARAADGVDPFDPDVAAVLRAGVTAVFVAPPEGPGVNGTGLALHVRPDAPDAPAIAGEGAVIGTLGTSRGRDAGPIARVLEVEGIIGLLRAADGQRKALEKYGKDQAAYEKRLAELEKAKKEAEKKEAGKKDGEGKAAEEKKAEPPKEPVAPTPPPPNPAAEALVPVLDRKATLRIRADGAEEILSALRILDAFDVRLVLLGAGEAPRVLADVASSRVALLVGPLVVDDPAGAADVALPKQLADAGVPFAIATFSRPGRGSRFLTLHAAAAERGGLSRDAALRAVTLDAARLSGVGDRSGSLEPGKDADLVLWSGHPVDTRSRAVRVLLGGETVWEERP